MFIRYTHTETCYSTRHYWSCGAAGYCTWHSAPSWCAGWESRRSTDGERSTLWQTCHQTLSPASAHHGRKQHCEQRPCGLWTLLTLLSFNTQTHNNKNKWFKTQLTVQPQSVQYSTKRFWLKCNKWLAPTWKVSTVGPFCPWRKWPPGYRSGRTAPQWWCLGGQHSGKPSPLVPDSRSSDSYPLTQRLERDKWKMNGKDSVKAYTRNSTDFLLEN